MVNRARVMEAILEVCERGRDRNVFPEAGGHKMLSMYVMYPHTSSKDDIIIILLNILSH